MLPDKKVTFLTSLYDEEKAKTFKPCELVAADNESQDNSKFISDDENESTDQVLEHLQANGNILI